jgi:anthranilate phosphoribosyltransferase
VLRETLRKAAEGRTLSEGEAERALEAIMEGTVAPAATAALLTALRVKGEAVPEIVGFARAMRRFAASWTPRRTSWTPAGPAATPRAP